MIVVGIDPGASGALAAIEGRRGEPTKLLEIIDAPMIGDASLRRVDAGIVLAFLARHKPNRGIIERAQAMPVMGRKVAKDSPEAGEEWKGQGATSAFKYGGTFYCMLFAFDGMGIRWESCEVSQWKKTNGLGGIKDKKIAKDQARHQAAMMFGGAPFARVMDHNRAEAALIAWHGLQLFLSAAGSEVLQRSPTVNRAPDLLDGASGIDLP